MTYKTIITKAFNSDLRKLLTQGNKKVVQAARAAITEAGTTGEIQSLPRTKHGESRIQNVEKYDLPDAFRLVVQLVNGVEKTRAFLFVGNHDDAQHWLDVHKNYKWVKNTTDGMLEFVMVTVESCEKHVPSDRLNLESPEEILQLPLLRNLAATDWDTINLDVTAMTFSNAITGSDFEQDAESIFERLEKFVGYDKASLLFDLMWHSHKNEWDKFSQRLKVVTGGATVVSTEIAAIAMAEVDNSESFFTFDDQNLLIDFFEKNTMADWMLFLHPEQKKIVERDLRGAARLRGVSGSGKTCVLVHRARYLAKKYGERVLLVTLTESMRRLLDRLIDDLCGVERSLIETKTMSMLAKDTLHELDSRRYTPNHFITPERNDELFTATVKYVREHSNLVGTPFQTMAVTELNAFLRDEIPYVRGRLIESEVEKYLDPNVFQRRGRGMPLTQPDRRIMLTAIKYYVEQLKQSNLHDHEELVSNTIQLLKSDHAIKGEFRSVLCDEVQDLSELDITLIGQLRTPDGGLIAKTENALFLAGDGTQSIYKRGFVLRRIGIDIIGRSYGLKKNYRNTHEILQAAFGLVSQYEFADIDEENIVRPFAPEFAKRHGTKPLLLRCSGLEEEANAIANAVDSLLAMGQTPGQICIIGPNARSRELVKRALDSKNIESIELRQDVDYESERVKISTIESAKGHEFANVFILHLMERVLPASGVHTDDLPREAARLYVAMTRAREALTITYSPQTGQQASRFLAAIQKDCDEAHFRNGEVRYLKD